jgi:signal transduction histidine kinase
LFVALRTEQPDAFLLGLTLLIFVWATWAAVGMARYLKTTETELRHLNQALRENQTLLEERIAQRTRELEASQAQVLHQEKMAAFGLLAAGIAHEVGNPLTSISGIVQMLEGRDPDLYTQTKLQLVTTELARIQTILRELITFSRPTGDSVGPVDLAGVVHDALRLAKFYKGGKNRRIVAVVPVEGPPLVGVRDRFVQIVFNLVLNAIDATEKGGLIEVQVEWQAEAHRWGLFVRDDGHGISPEHQSRLFQPYFTTKQQGTGLGLFVIKKLVEEDGGFVTVESQLGEGATFRIYWPVRDFSPAKLR